MHPSLIKTSPELAKKLLHSCRSFLLFSSLAIGIGMTLSACQSKSNSSAESAPASQVAAPTKERGKTVYNSYCIACHNPDPKKPGSLGPELVGSSKELLEARILKAEYPEGYKPKRTTKTMPPFPYLKNDIDSLHLFLNQ